LQKQDCAAHINGRHLCCDMVVVGPVVAADEHNPDVIQVLDGFDTVTESQLAALQRTDYLDPDASFAGTVASVARALKLLTLTPAMLPRRFEVTIVAGDAPSEVPNTWAVQCPDYSFAPFAQSLPLPALLQRDNTALQPLIRNFNDAFEDGWSVTCEDLLLGFDTGLVKPSQPLRQPAPSILLNSHIFVAVRPLPYPSADRASVTECHESLAQFHKFIKGERTAPFFVNVMQWYTFPAPGSNTMAYLTATVETSDLAEHIHKYPNVDKIDIVVPLECADIPTLESLRDTESKTFYPKRFQDIEDAKEKREIEAQFDELFNLVVNDNNAQLHLDVNYTAAEKASSWFW